MSESPNKSTDLTPDDSWAKMDMTTLVDHIESVHHTYLNSALPQLGALVDKVVDAHADTHPELHEVQSVYRALWADLAPHLMKEERMLFPMIRELAQAEASPEFHCGSVLNPISVMVYEHDKAEELLAQLRHLTDGYTPPEDACTNYNALYAGLTELEADTLLHIHKEGTVLFPAAMRVEQELGAATA